MATQPGIDTEHIVAKRTINVHCPDGHRATAIHHLAPLLDSYVQRCKDILRLPNAVKLLYVVTMQWGGWVAWCFCGLPLVLLVPLFPVRCLCCCPVASLCGSPVRCRSACVCVSLPLVDSSEASFL